MESRESLFDRELMEVIFSHVSNTERLGKETLPELIDYLTNEKEALISQLATELSEVNAAIVALEDQMTEEYRKSLDASLEQRRAELKAHDEAKPVEIYEPEQDAQAQDATKLVTDTLAELQRKTEELDQQLAGEREQLRESALQIVAADKLFSPCGEPRKRSFAHILYGERGRWGRIGSQPKGVCYPNGEPTANFGGEDKGSRAQSTGEDFT